MVLLIVVFGRNSCHVPVVDAGCELRIRHIVEESSADNIEPFQTKMTQFVTQGKLIVLLSNI